MFQLCAYLDHADAGLHAVALLGVARAAVMAETARWLLQRRLLDRVCDVLENTDYVDMVEAALELLEQVRHVGQGGHRA